MYFLPADSFIHSHTHRHRHACALANVMKLFSPHEGNVGVFFFFYKVLLNTSMLRPAPASSYPTPPRSWLAITNLGREAGRQGEGGGKGNKQKKWTKITADPVTPFKARGKS